MINARGFVEEVVARTGAQDREAVARTVAATLAVLGRRLRPVDARAVAARLDASLAAHLLESAHADLEAAEVLRRLSLAGDAGRIARATCRLLAESLDEQARAQLRMHDLRPLLQG